MPLQTDNWANNPLKKLAEPVPIKDPGMYIIALRAHLTRGKQLIGDIVDTVAGAFPKAPKMAASNSEREEQPS